MSREVMQQALEALKKYHFYTIDIGHPNHSMLHEGFKAFTALREALAQPEQGPVLFIHPSTLEMASASVVAWKPGNELSGYISLYTAPPAPQPLTDEQAKKIFRMARDLEDTGRLSSLSETDRDRAEWCSKNQNIQCALQDYLAALTDAVHGIND